MQSLGGRGGRPCSHHAPLRAPLISPPAPCPRLCSFFVILTLVRFLEGGNQCCGSSSRKHAAHAQPPQVVVVQQPPAGTYPAYPPPAGQFMTAANDVKV